MYVRLSIQNRIKCNWNNELHKIVQNAKIYKRKPKYFPIYSAMEPSYILFIVKNYFLN